jgi:hypothetical protein
MGHSKEPTRLHPLLHVCPRLTQREPAVLPYCDAFLPPVWTHCSIGDYAGGLEACHYCTAAPV